MTDAKYLSIFIANRAKIFLLGKVFITTTINGARTTLGS